MKPQITLAELAPGKLALCIREGKFLHIMMSLGWRTINMRDIPFQGITEVVVPPVKDWPK
jgi:hypothetical protein